MERIHRRVRSLNRTLVCTGLFVVLAAGAATAAEKTYPSVTLWPLAYHYEDPDEARTDVLWPIYHQKRRGMHTRTAIRPLLFNYETDPTREFRQLNVLWPLTQFEAEGETFRRWVVPVYYHRQTADASTLHLWPLYGHARERDGTESWSTLYPFFQYRRNAATDDWRTDYLWPLGRSYRSGEVSGSYFIPLWWRRSAPDASGGYVFPYFWNSSAERRQKALVPLWYSARSDREQTDYLLLWYGTRNPERTFRTLFPLFWQRRTGDGQGYTLAAPLYWSSDSDTDRFRVLFPFYFRHRDIEHDSELRYYFPLYGDYRSGGHIRDRYYLFPLYVSIDDPELQRRAWYFLWPLVYTERTPDTFQSWAIPFYRVVRRPDSEKTMIAGLYWSKRQPDYRSTLLIPFYLHYQHPEGEGRHYLPFYSDIRKPDGYRKRLWLGPVAITTRDPSRGLRQVDVLWPLVSRKEEGDKRHTRALPFYWHDERPGRSLTVGTLALLPPYYLNYRTEERDDFHLWPFYGRARDRSYRENSVAWPLFRWGASPDGERRAWQMLLAYSSRAPERRFSGFFPLWHHDRTADRTRTISLLHWQENEAGGDRQFSLLHLGHPDWSLASLRTQGDESHHHLFPLYSYTVDRSADSSRLWLLGPVYFQERVGADRMSRALLWKVLYSEKSADRSETGFLWRLVRSRTDRQGHLFEFNPFYYSDEGVDGEAYTSWLGGLYSVRRGAAGVKRTLFWMLSW